MSSLRNTMLYRMLDHQEAEQARKDAQAFAATQALTGAVERTGNQAVQQERFNEQQDIGRDRMEQQEGQFQDQRQDMKQSRAQQAAAQLMGLEQRDKQFEYQKDQDAQAFDFRQQQLAQQKAQADQQTTLAWYNAQTMRERADASIALAEAKQSTRRPNPVVEKEIREAEDSLATMVSIERDFAPEKIYGWQQFATSKLQAPLASGLSYLGADTLAGAVMDPKEQQARANWESRLTSLVSPIISKNFGASRSGADLKEAAMAFAQAKGNPVQYAEAFKNMKAAQERHILLRSQALAGTDIETLTPEDLDRKMNSLYDQVNGKRGPTSAGGVPQSQPGPTPNKIKERYNALLDAGYSSDQARQAIDAEFP